MKDSGIRRTELLPSKFTLGEPNKKSLRVGLAKSHEAHRRATVWESIKRPVNPWDARKAPGDRR